MTSSSTNPPAAKIQRHEGQVEGHAGCELFYQTWSRADDPAPRSTFVITHGISEHSECYAHTAESLVARGWNVCAWDLRGHGRSAGKRGYVENFHNYALDLGALLRQLKKFDRLQDRFVLFGHSMGGLVTLRHLADEEAKTPKPAALALSAPALGFSIAVPKVKDVAARIFNRVLPSITLYNEIRYDDLTHDAELLKTYALDPLRHDKISPAVYLGMIESFEVAVSRANRLSMPVIVQLSGQERIVSSDAIKAYFPKIGSAKKKLFVYNDSFHEIFNDVERETVLNDLDKFLRENGATP